MSDWWDDHDDAHRVPKVVYMVVAKGRDPNTNRAKTWVRVHTSKVSASDTQRLWEKHKFLDVRLLTCETDWKEVA